MSPTWTALEQNIIEAVNSAHAPVLDAVAYGVNIVFGPSVAILVVALFALVIGIAARSWVRSVAFALLVIVPWGVTDVLKAVVQRSRPAIEQLTHPSSLTPSTFSFPSGHVAIVVALATAIVLFFPVAWRASALSAAAVVVISTMWSRVYLGVHFPSDVLASLLLVPVLSWAVWTTLQRLAATGVGQRQWGMKALREAVGESGATHSGSDGNGTAQARRWAGSW